MPKYTEEFVVKLIADNKRLKKGLDEGKKDLNKFGQQVAKIGGTLAAAFSVGALIKFGKTALRLSDIQLVAEQKLLVALKGRKDIQERLLRQASELQGITRFGDEATIGMQSLLSTFGLTEKEIMKLVPLVQDMSVALGMDLNSAALMTAKSITSSVDALARYFVTGLSGVEGQSKRTEVLVEALTKKFEGQAEAMAQLGMGPAVQLGNAFGDLQESMGDILALKFKDEINNLRDAVIDLNIVLGSKKGGTQDELSKLGQLIKISNPFTYLKVGAQLAREEIYKLLHEEAEAVKKAAEAPRKARIGGGGFGLDIPLPSGLPSIGHLLETDEEKKKRREKELAEAKKATNKMEKVMKEEIMAWGEYLSERKRIQQESTKAGAYYTATLDMEAEKMLIVAEKMQAFGNIIAEAFANVFIGIGEGIGEMIAGTSGMEGFLNNILKIVVDFGKSLGKLLITIGAGLTLIGFGPGIAMVAIGTALVALGTAGGILLDKKAQGQINAGGISSGMNVNVTGRLQGSTILLASERAAEQRSNVT